MEAQNRLLELALIVAQSGTSTVAGFAHPDPLVSEAALELAGLLQDAGDACWKCLLAASATPVGLCTSCLQALRES